jgi:hypothetical protein
MTIRILPLRTGWDPAPDEMSFYPDGLPPEWRLTYLANELDGLLVAAPEWCSADPRLIGQWRLDVPARFRFFLEVEGVGPGTGVCALARDMLDDRFGGWVASRDVREETGLVEPVYESVGSSSALADSSASRLACRVPETHTEDLRSARLWLEGVAAAAAGRPTLVLMGQARVEDVRRWQALVELLGFT